MIPLPVWPAFPGQLAVLATAMAIDFAVGYPDALYRLIGHPVTWIGALIRWLDDRLNRVELSDDLRRINGVITFLIVTGVSLAAGFWLQLVLAMAFAGLAVTAVMLSSLLAARSLHDHVKAVETALRDGGLEAGRVAVSRIVGRDVNLLDNSGVCRAAIESLAENFSDGVVAPAFWAAVGGLPAAAGYKAVNTLDSMIGHKNDRYLFFGRASARMDDLVNLPASRLTALFVLLAALFTGKSVRDGWTAIRRDAHRHKSPNAGWPEAAMAGALGIRLAGPRVYYGGRLVDDGYMGNGRLDLTADDIAAALRLYRAAIGLMWVTVAGGALLSFSL